VILALSQTITTDNPLKMNVLRYKKSLLDSKKLFVRTDSMQRASSKTLIYTAISKSLPRSSVRL
jgi:hypothetical protein